MSIWTIRTPYCATRPNGAVAERYDTDPYGAVATTDVDGGGLLGNRIAMAGQWWDATTNLYYMRARHYSPILKRFASGDPLGVWGDSTNFGNRYSYVSNMTTRALDPLGLAIVAVSGFLAESSGRGDNTLRRPTGGGQRAGVYDVAANGSDNNPSLGGASGYAWNDHENIIDRVLDDIQRYPDQPVVLIGHSFGGDTAAEASDVLYTEHGILTDLLIQMDSVGAHDDEGFATTRVNIFDENISFPAGMETQSQAERQGLNFGVDSSHTEIDDPNKAGDRIVQEQLRALADRIAAGQPLANANVDKSASTNPRVRTRAQRERERERERKDADDRKKSDSDKAFKEKADKALNNNF